MQASSAQNQKAVLSIFDTFLNENYKRELTQKKAEKNISMW